MPSAFIAVANRIAAGWGALVGNYGRMVVDGARIGQFLEAPLPDEPCIWVGWHGAVLVTLGLHRRLRARPVTSFSPIGVSGEAMMAWLRVFNVTPVPITGTTSDGLMLRRLREAVGKGSDVLIAADGPAGPRWRAKPGALWLGSVTGVPVIPVGAAASPSIKLPRWDRHLVPMPGARIAVAVGAPFDRGIDPRGSGSAAAIQSAIDRLTAIAAASLG
jgi:lysophospholipid acyltransferase (LPLAT)-like uncharacterized protein